jgi:hypothetical protein
MAEHAYFSGVLNSGLEVQHLEEAADGGQRLVLQPVLPFERH